MTLVDITYKKNGQIFTLQLSLGYNSRLPHLCVLDKTDLFNLFNGVVPLKICAKFPGIHAGFELMCCCCDEIYRFDIMVGDSVTSATLLQISAPSKGELFLANIA